MKKLYEFTTLEMLIELENACFFQCELGIRYLSFKGAFDD